MMAAPTKPWERANIGNDVLNRTIPSSTLTNFPQDQLVNTDGAFGGAFGGGGFATQAPPPIPPRPQTDYSSRFGYSPMGHNSSPYMSMYSPYSQYSGAFGGYGGYGSYGGYGGFGGVGGIGYGANIRADNQFIQLAEENYRNALQPIESFIHTIGSINMMLENTFYSLNSSFRAVLAVADQFAKLRAHMGHVFSIFALFRGLRWLYTKVLASLGIISPGSVSDAWHEAENVLTDDKQSPRKSRWPILIFLALISGTPWLVLKLLSLTSPQSPSTDWAAGKADHVVAQVLYDFQGENNGEISIKAGDRIKLAPKELQPNMRSSWILATSDGKTIGLVPTNYVKPLARVKGTTNMDKIFEESSN